MFKKLFANTFSSLKYRNFRLFAFGQLVSLTGSWAQGIALSWVAYELTNSPVTLGVIAMLSFGPLLVFGIFGGHFADRFPKYQTLLVTQILHSLAPFVVAILFFTGDISINVLYACALVAGILRVVDNPTRQAFRLFLIPKDETKNAISIISSTNSLARIVGPLFAGFLLSAFGPAWCFLVNALSFWFVVLTMIKMDKKEFTKSEVAGAFKDTGILLSLSYIYKHQVLRDTLILSTIIGVLFLNSQVLFPIFTKEVFSLGSFSYSVIVSVYSAGSILGGLYAAYDKALSRQKLRKVCYFLGFSFILLSLSVPFWVFLILVFLTGFVSSQVTSVANSFLVLETEDKYLGMVTSMWSMAIVGTTAVGGIIIGYASEQFGVQYFTLASGILLIVAIFFWYKKR